MSKKITKTVTKSFVGRMLRRLLGEENGAIMMEYIVLALLIASVAVVAIAAFGNHITGLFGVIGLSAGGRSSAAQLSLKQVDTTHKSNTDKAQTHANKMQDEQMDEVPLDETGRGV